MCSNRLYSHKITDFDHQVISQETLLNVDHFLNFDLPGADNWNSSWGKRHFSGVGLKLLSYSAKTNYL